MKIKINLSIFSTTIAIILVVILALLIPALTKWTLIVIAVLWGRFSMYVQYWIDEIMIEEAEEREEENYGKD